jgi:hypothetical protein
MNIIIKVKVCVAISYSYYQDTNKAIYRTVLPLTRIFPCSKEILVLARNLQGNKIYKEMARKNTKIKGNCKDFCNLYQLQVLNQ